MKIQPPKEPRINRVIVLIQTLTDKGRTVGRKAGYPKGKNIQLYDTSVDEVYEVILKALTAAAMSDKEVK